MTRFLLHLIAIFSTFICFTSAASMKYNTVSITNSSASSVIVSGVNLKKWFGTGCQCINYDCGCCAHLEVPRIGLNDTGCVNLTYLPKDYGISFTVTIDNLTIYNETISARDPPPYCFGAPMIKEYADLCIHFYDLSFGMDHLHGCVDLEARLNHIRVGKYHIGCFTIGHPTINGGPASNSTKRIIVNLI